MFGALLLLLFIQINEGVEDVNEILNNRNSMTNHSYCSICCIDIQKDTVGKSCGTHTMCRYPENETGPGCTGFVRVRFTDTEKQSLTDLHNSLRNGIALGNISAGTTQLKASNMRMLEWNEELALIAERWAAQCVYGKDLCRDLEKFPVGQNIARGNLATKSDLSLVMTWFNEAKFFNAAEVSRYDLSLFGKTSSRFTQLIWADSYLLGCARAMFQASKASRVTYIEHLICNYGPTGNIPNQPVFKIGEPCTQCQEGTACKESEYPALCAVEMQDEFNDYLDLTINAANIVKSLRFFCIFTVFSQMFIFTYF